MFTFILLSIIYVGLTLLEKLIKKEELEKAKEESYDVFFR